MFWQNRCARGGTRSSKRGDGRACNVKKRRSVGAGRAPPSRDGRATAPRRSPGRILTCRARALRDEKPLASPSARAQPPPRKPSGSASRIKRSSTDHLALHIDRRRRAAGHRRGPATRELNEDALVRRMSRTINALTSTKIELYVAIVKLKADNGISAKKIVCAIAGNDGNNAGARCLVKRCLWLNFRRDIILGSGRDDVFLSITEAARLENPNERGPRS